MSLYRRLLNVFRSRDLNRDIDDELEFHRQMLAKSGAESGRHMGNVALAREEMRDARVIGWLASSLQDLRHGVVLLRRDAAISALIIVVLALGIGGNAMMFTLLKAAFLDPLPYRDSERLVTVIEEGRWNPSVSEYLAIRARSRTLERLAYAEHRDMQVSGSDEPTRVYAARVTASFFPLLGVNAALGRTFLEEENEPGRAPAVILSDSFWRSKMGADGDVVGRTLRLDGQASVVVGVLPAGFHFDYPTLRISEPVDIYVSMAIERSAPFRSSGAGASVPFRMLAQLREGTTVAEAESEIHALGKMLTQEHPTAYRSRDGGLRPLQLDVVPLRQAIVGPQGALLTMLSVGAGVLLLIACANTAQLLLARSLRRRKEVAIRAALGAGRLRLIRQFVLEGLILALCGGALGLMVAYWMANVLVALLPVPSPLLEAAHIDGRVIAFTLGASVISAILSSIVPAITGSISPSMLNVRTGTGEGSLLRHAMLALEASLSVFLLCGAGLVTQNLWTLLSTPMGFDPNHVMVFRLKSPPGQTKGLQFDEYLARIVATPGVDSAATATGPPLRPSVSGPNELVGVKGNDGRLKSVIGDNHLVSADYFRTLRIPLLAGRTFRDDEAAEANEPWRVAIVNEEFARRFGFGRDIVGRHIFDPTQPLEIVGMVGNVRTRGRQTAAVPEVYLPSLRFSWTNQYLVVRSVLPPEQLVKQVTEAIRSSNSEQVLYGVMTMDRFIADAVTEPRFHAFVTGLFALLAVAMAAAGMYSVVSCLVAQRTSEIAIRMALGASRRAITKTVLGTTMAWIAGGLIAGLGLGLAARSTIRALSTSVVEGSPWMYMSVLVFFLSSDCSVWAVARASRLDPSVALRCE